MSLLLVAERRQNDEPESVSPSPQETHQVLKRKKTTQRLKNRVEDKQKEMRVKKEGDKIRVD